MKEQIKTITSALLKSPITWHWGSAAIDTLPKVLTDALYPKQDWHKKRNPVLPNIENHTHNLIVSFLDALKTIPANSNVDVRLDPREEMALRINIATSRYIGYQQYEEARRSYQGSSEMTPKAEYLEQQMGRGELFIPPKLLQYKLKGDMEDSPTDTPAAASTASMHQQAAAASVPEVTTARDRLMAERAKPQASTKER